ncbi:MAG: type I-U CRISPR-associated protein Csx17 [Verrucomicrobiota bacterium]
MSPPFNLPLAGCAPVPLAHYLKALGILRLVAEQADPTAAGCWQRDTFTLHSALDRDALLDFFLHRYQPTPILAPWNGGSGFYKKDNTEAIQAIEAGASSRMQHYRQTIAAARRAVAEANLKEKPSSELKESLLLACRNELPEPAVLWLDAAFVLTADGAKYPPLLGTGGNDGRLEFTNNFMQRLTEVMQPADGIPTAASAAWLAQSLFGEPVPTPRSKAPIGQFFPGAAGGVNGTSGFDADSAVNPWDYILMLEGALLFAAASVKRLEAGQAGVLAYPFCVKQAGVGYASAAGADEEGARAEMWLPLWERPATLPELAAVLGEGRAQVGKRAARNGVDFTRAVVTLGVDRGLSAFQRFGFQVRNGLAYFATPLERVAVRRNARADLLSEADRWMARLRDKAGPTAKQPPASVSRALRQLEGCVLELCKQDDGARLQAVLIALGTAERAVGRSMRWATETAFLRPLQGLSPRWLAEADTGSREFRLAAALASLSGNFGEDWLALRCHLEPVVTPRRGQFAWAANATNDVQWSAAPLPDVLNAIFARRLIRAEKAGTGGLPDTARYYASVADIAAFIEGETDDALLANLLWGLCLIDWSVVAENALLPGACAPPALYALLKLCFLPQHATEKTIPLVPAIHRRAVAGEGAAASQLAARRLRASGFPPALREIPLHGAVVQRTAAALLFPLAHCEWTNLRETVLRPAELSRA